MATEIDIPGPPDKGASESERISQLEKEFAKLEGLVADDEGIRKDIHQRIKIDNWSRVGILIAIAFFVTVLLAIPCIALLFQIKLLKSISPLAQSFLFLSPIATSGVIIVSTIFGVFRKYEDKDFDYVKSAGVGFGENLLKRVGLPSSSEN